MSPLGPACARAPPHDLCEPCPLTYPRPPVSCAALPSCPAYPPTAGAVTAIAVFRATPPSGLSHGCTWPLRMFERHSFTTQAFLPMAKGEWGGGVGEPAMAREEGEGGMLVVVALNGPGASFPGAASFLALGVAVC